MVILIFFIYAFCDFIIVINLLRSKRSIIISIKKFNLGGERWFKEQKRNFYGGALITSFVNLCAHHLHLVHSYFLHGHPFHKMIWLIAYCIKILYYIDYLNEWMNESIICKKKMLLNTHEAIITILTFPTPMIGIASPKIFYLLCPRELRFEYFLESGKETASMHSIIVTGDNYRWTKIWQT